MKVIYALMMLCLVPSSLAVTYILQDRAGSNVTNNYYNNSYYNVTGITNGSDAYLSRLNITGSLFANASRTINDAYANRFRLTSGYFVVSDNGWYWDNGVGGFLATGAGLALDHISSYGYDSRLTIEQDTGINTPVPVATLHVTASEIGEPSIIAQGTAGQTADLFQALDSTSNELFTVTADGHVGITDSSPASLFSVKNNDLDLMSVGSETSRYLSIINGSGAVIYMGDCDETGHNTCIALTDLSQDIRLDTPGTVRLGDLGGYGNYTHLSINAPAQQIIMEYGNVGIETIDPTQSLDVRGNVNFSGIVYYGAIGSQMRLTSNGTNVLLQTTTGATADLLIKNINATGNITSNNKQVCLSDGTNCPAGSGDNTSWNQSGADIRYYPRDSNPAGFYNITTLPAGGGDNTSWNQSLGDTRYYSTTNPSSYYNLTTAIVKYTLFNYTTTDIRSVDTARYNRTLTLQLPPSTTVSVECLLLQNGAAATTGVQLQVNTTSSPTYVQWSYTGADSASIFTSYSGTNTASNTFADVGSSIGIGHSWLNGYIVTGAGGSNISIDMKTEVNASAATIYRGSNCKVITLS